MNALSGVKARIYEGNFSRTINLNDGEIIDAIERYLIEEEYTTKEKLNRYETEIEEIKL